MTGTVKEKYGLEGVIYLVVLALGMTLTIGFAAFSFFAARDARNQSDATVRLVSKLCSASAAARVDSNEHVRFPLRQLLLDAAYARQVASTVEDGKRAQVDAATAEKYRLLASQVTTLPPLTC